MKHLWILILLMKNVESITYEKKIARATPTETADFKFKVLEPKSIPLKPLKAIQKALRTEQKARNYTLPIIQTDGQHSSCRLTTFDPYEDCNYIDEEIFSPQDFSSVNGLIGVLETGSFNFLADVTNDGGIISDTNKVLGKLQL